MSIKDFFKKLFGKKNDLETKMVEEVTSESVKDIFGNDVKVGDYVIEVMYDERKRRSYVTILTPFTTTRYSSATNFEFLKAEAYVDGLANGVYEFTNSKRHGFGHVSLTNA